MSSSSPYLLAQTAKERAELMRVNALFLSIVIPIFNEAQAIPLFLDAIINQVCTKISIPVELVFVNDGSTDNSMDILLKEMNAGHPCLIKAVDLSRNFGKEAAMTAGLQIASGQMIVPMDVDLQDPRN